MSEDEKRKRVDFNSGDTIRAAIHPRSGGAERWTLELTVPPNVDVLVRHEKDNRQSFHKI